MDDEQHEAFLKKYREDVEWLRRCISPDDIYEFAEQSLIAATLFLSRWDEWVDITEEAQKDRATASWIRNILGIRMMRENGYEGPIEFEFKNPDEEL